MLSGGFRWIWGKTALPTIVKVMRVGCCRMGGHFVFQLRIFSLRGNVWKKFLCKLLANEPGAHVKGSINFVGVKDHESYYWSVLRLGLASESYQDVPLPNCADPCVKPMIMALVGRLCTILVNCKAVDVW